MRLFLKGMALLLAAGVIGCDSKSEPAPTPPPGVYLNPHRPDPEAIKKRKERLVDPPIGGAPAGPHQKH